VVAFDPLVATLPNPRVDVAGSPNAVIEAANAVVLATPDPAFTTLDWAGPLARRPALVVLDAWRLLRDAIPASAAGRYHVLGRGPAPGASAETEARLAALWTGSSVS
jgi:hypothetical protein